jgi:hypothetical protein
MPLLLCSSPQGAPSHHLVERIDDEYFVNGKPFFGCAMLEQVVVRMAQASYVAASDTWSAFPPTPLGLPLTVPIASAAVLRKYWEWPLTKAVTTEMSQNAGDPVRHKPCLAKWAPARTSSDRFTPSCQGYAFLWETQTEDLYLEQGPAQPGSAPHKLHHLSPALPPAAQVGENPDTICPCRTIRCTSFATTLGASFSSLANALARKRLAGSSG